MISDSNSKNHGRGAAINTPNRFMKSTVVADYEEGLDELQAFSNETQWLKENAKTIVNKVTSTDVGMAFSLNPYQGCEHGCIYCYARNTHEYWGYSAGVDFEQKIIVKHNAPELFKKHISAKNYSPEPISLSGNTDCYQPAERTFKLTRQLLSTALAFNQPIGIITKNALILRDLDILSEMAKKQLVCVYISITSLDESLRRMLEPRTVTAARRLQTIQALSKQGVPVGIMTAPIIPGINEQEIPHLLKAAADSGALYAGHTIVRLNGAIQHLFKEWLFRTMPDRAEKVWHLIESCHGGTVNDNQFGRRMRGDGPVAEMIRKQHQLFCKKYSLNKTRFQFNTSAFKIPTAQQALF